MIIERFEFEFLSRASFSFAYAENKGLVAHNHSSAAM